MTLAINNFTEKKMLRKFISTLMFISLMFIQTSSVLAAIDNSEDQNYKKAVYHVGTKEGEVSSIENFKTSLDNIGAHIQNNHQGKPDLSILIVVHGDHIQWLKKTLIDEELKFMVNWFLDNHVELKICRPGLKERNLNLAILVDGLQLYNH
jgi:intracellular sulfur oxidation DsrE/DsrF family protein